MKGTLSQPSQGTFCCSQIFHFAFSKPPFCGLRWWGHRTVPTQPALTLESASTWIGRCLDPILPQAPCTLGGGCQDSHLVSGCDSEHCGAAEVPGEMLSESLLGARNSFLPEATLVLGTEPLAQSQWWSPWTPKQGTSPGQVGGALGSGNSAVHVLAGPGKEP